MPGDRGGHSPGTPGSTVSVTSGTYLQKTSSAFQEVDQAYSLK